MTAFSGGCASNHARFERNSVEAEGTPRLLASTTYYHVTVGSRQSPYNGTPEFRIRLDSGRVVSSREITTELAAAECLRTSVGGRYGWPENARTFVCRSYEFIFVENRLVSLTAGAYPDSRAAFGRADDGPLYGFPLTSQQLTEIFGKPGKEYKYFGW
jgi:hypothetical protein